MSPRFRTAAPILKAQPGRSVPRQSPDSSWPLRRADGRAWSADAPGRVVAPRPARSRPATARSYRLGLMREALAREPGAWIVIVLLPAALIALALGLSIVGG